MAPILAGFKGFLVQMMAWGLKIACKKFEEMFTKIDICLQKMVKWFFYHIFAQLHAHLQFIFVCKMDVHCTMKCSCGWGLLNSASQPLAELESWTMRPADFIRHFHSFWRINLREKLICSKLDGDRGHFPWKWRCSHFLMENRKASQGGK